jgi:branched-chain amino acid transport system ATP-binding protein/urea transport system ATP-binding protein
MKLLEVHGLHCGYGSIPILRDVSLQVAGGSAVGILGHNGMGKTTLLRCLTGALPATAGEIHMAGCDVTRLPPHQRAGQGMAYVPQGRQIFASLSVLENLQMGFVKNGARGRDAADALLEIFPRLKPLVHRAGGALSGGEQQLLAIARALAGDPKMLLLDEPTEGIQPSILEEIAQTLTQLQNRTGLTLVLAEQNLDFIASVVHRVLVIKRGQISGEIPVEYLNDIDIVNEYTGAVG